MKKIPNDGEKKFISSSEYKRFNLQNRKFLTTKTEESPIFFFFFFNFREKKMHSERSRKIIMLY